MGMLSKFGLAYTAMGNNMAITRDAYEAVGGYGNIPASITEDYELFRQASRKGFRLIHLFKPTVLGMTQPQDSLGAWFSQHLRWMNGFRQLSIFHQLPLFLNMLLLPLLFVSFICTCGTATTSFLSAIFLAKFLFFTFSLLQIQKWRLLLLLPIFELIYAPVYAALLLSSIFLKKIDWKGRMYASGEEIRM
jgi:cellulose synthase/poly-beta-1,6-N-acetylglucosamine synthase-like glycosyltransferase